MKITQINANLTLYPTFNPERLGLDRNATWPQELTLGDLSGNLLMLIWVLVTAGLAKMSEENYLALVNLQQEINHGHDASFARDKNGNKKTMGGTPKKPGFPYIDTSLVKGLSEEQHQTFLKVLEGIAFTPNPILLRLIGDEMADRLGDSSEMIETLDKMAEQKLRFHIMSSNHLHLLVECFLSKLNEDEDEEDRLDGLIANGQGVSLLHMLQSIKNGWVKDEVIRQKIGFIYPERLLLLDYSFGHSDTDMTLYAHAPFDLQSIVDAAIALNVTVPALFQSTKEVALFIGNVNAAFKKCYGDVYFSGKTKEALPELSQQAISFSSDLHPVGALLWMKTYPAVTGRAIPACFQKINVTLQHGHINNPEPRVMENRVSLNVDSDQPMNRYSFPVAVTTHKPEVASRNTDSPAAFTSEIPKTGFMPIYHRLNELRGPETDNASPATDSNTPTPGTKN